MLEPKEIEIGTKKYIIHKFPAWQGVLIMSRLPDSLSLEMEGLKQYEEVLAEIFTYIAVVIPKGKPLFLTTPELINNHVKSWKEILLLFNQIIGYNNDFLVTGES